MKFDFENSIEKFKYDPNSVKKNYDGKTDIYLAKASYRYAYIKRLLCVALAFVMVLFLLSGALSYEKLYYLAKDVKLANDYVNSEHDTITYNVGNSQTFAIYREGLAVASRERFSIFSSGGRELLSFDHNLGNPKLASSDKYVLLYDVGGKQFSLYNSFSKVYDKTLDNPIYGASVSENGTYAIITSSLDYTSIVSVYKSNGTKYDYNFASARVVSVCLSEKGKDMAVLLAYSSGDEIRSEIRLYRIGKNDYESESISFSGIPYAVQILSGGNILVVGANGINAFNSNLNLVGEYFANEEIYLYSFGEDSIAISYFSSESGKTDVLVLNKRGKLENEIEFNERIIDIALCDGYIFVQKIGGFERINLSNEKSVQIDYIALGYKMIVGDKKTLIICADSHAKYLDFGK